MVAYNWHLNIEILSRLFLHLCRLKIYDLMLYRLPVTMVIATASSTTSASWNTFTTICRHYNYYLDFQSCYVVGFVEKIIMVAYNWHLNIEILSRLLLLLCRLTMYDLMLYRLPLIMVVASAGHNIALSYLQENKALTLYDDLFSIIFL